MIQATLVRKLEPEYVVSKHGTKRSYDSKGRLHSFYDCPSLICSDGTTYWHKKGRRHRDNNRPAVIWYDGSKEWWVDGELIRKEQ
jgi:hypothetical protein